MNAPSEKQRQQLSAPAIRNIVVAVDLSPHSEKTVAYAVDIARTFGATIHLVYVHTHESITEYTTKGIHENIEEERRGLEQELKNLCERTRETYPNCSAEFRVPRRRTRFGRHQLL